MKISIPMTTTWELGWGGGGGGGDRHFMGNNAITLGGL